MGGRGEVEGRSWEVKETGISGLGPTERFSREMLCFHCFLLFSRVFAQFCCFFKNGRFFANFHNFVVFSSSFFILCFFLEFSQFCCFFFDFLQFSCDFAFLLCGCSNVDCVGIYSNNVVRICDASCRMFFCQSLAWITFFLWTELFLQKSLSASHMD